VHVRFLPAGVSSTFDYDAFVKSYERYMNNLVHRLDAPATKQALTPSLALLGSMITSVAVRG